MFGEAVHDCGFFRLECPAELCKESNYDEDMDERTGFSTVSYPITKCKEPCPVSAVNCVYKNVQIWNVVSSKRTVLMAKLSGFSDMRP